MTERSLEMMMEQSPAVDFRAGSLELLAAQLAIRNYPEYPLQADRLWLDEPAEYALEPIRLPDGPWETSGGHLPTLAEQADLLGRGISLDGHGRPLHPWFDQMIRDPRIGVVTGKGKYWRWGPNYTADSIIFRRDHAVPQVLLIRRKDTGLWALPGGFIEPHQTPLEAAIAEADQEANIDLAYLGAVGLRVYQGPLADLRLTANAWPETSAFKFELTHDQTLNLFIKGGDDAEAARWAPVNEALETLFGSHRLLIELALRSA